MRRSMYAIPVVLCAFFVCGLMDAGALELYVSLTGNDTNPGTKAKPFATLERARNEVRKLKESRTFPRDGVTVHVSGGFYFLTQPFVLGPADSGTETGMVSYKAVENEQPIISGGRTITGWVSDAGGRWKAKTDLKNFRQLYVNGVRAVRARGAAFPGTALQGEDGYTIPAPQMAGWRNVADIELIYPVVWTWTRCKVQSIEKQDNTAIVKMLQPWFYHARSKGGVKIELPMYIENAFELLDEPGEWYFDRPAGTVFYLPRPGEDMSKVEVIAPGIEKLVELAGTLDNPVHHVQFKGLTFTEAGWNKPSEIGLVDVQANFVQGTDNILKRREGVETLHNEYLKSPANVLCHAAHNIRFDGCTFTHLGGAGLDVEFGSRDNIILGCEFADISGTAIQIGDVLKNDHHPEDERMIVRNNTVSNCVIRGCAVEYKGGVGIFVGYTDSTIISHNEICYLPYTGVSVGWGWGEEDAGGGNPAYYQPFKYDTPTPSRANRIEFNHIHHTMLDLQDGGGIYTLGNQPGTVIRGNLIHDNTGMPGGIYLDEGSGFIEVTGNVVYAVKRAMNYNNRVQNRIATCNEHDNFWDDARTAPEGQKIIDSAGIGGEFRTILKRMKEENK